MHRFFVLFLFASTAFSCMKEDTVEPCAKPLKMTIQVFSENKAQVKAGSFLQETVEGKYSRTIEVPFQERFITVSMHSEAPGIKSITIYIDGQEVAKRSGNCATKDYGLSYDLNQYR